MRRRGSGSLGGAPRTVDLGDGVRLFDGAITIESTAALLETPALALRLYVESKRQGARVHPFARSAITRAAGDPAWCAALRASPEAGRLFVDLACTVAEAPARRGSIMAELHDIGLLLAMIPEFAPVTGRVHHDVYHVYTVDVHSVAALDCLRALARGELAQEQPLASRLAAEIARPEPLFLATLLHDIGKGYPDATGSRKNHSVSGAELCDAHLAAVRPRARRHGRRAARSSRFTSRCTTSRRGGTSTTRPRSRSSSAPSAAASSCGISSS